MKYFFILLCNILLFFSFSYLAPLSFIKNFNFLPLSGLLFSFGIYGFSFLNLIFLRKNSMSIFIKEYVEVKEKPIPYPDLTLFFWLGILIGSYSSSLFFLNEIFGSLFISYIGINSSEWAGFGLQDLLSMIHHTFFDSFNISISSLRPNNIWISIIIFIHRILFSYILINLVKSYFLFLNYIFRNRKYKN